MKKVVLNIAGMSCINCAKAIERAVSKIDNVASVNVNFATSCAEIEFENDETLNLIKEKISKLGFSVVHDFSSLNKEKMADLKKKFLKFIISLALSVIVMTIEMSHFNSFAFLSAFLCAIVLFYCGSDFFIHGYKGIKNKNFNMNVLISLGSSSAFFYSCIVVFFPNLISLKFHNFYFGSACMIITFVLFGKILEERSKFRANEYIRNLVDFTPKMANIVCKNGTSKQILAKDLKVGDVVLVKNGEAIACDGVILDGGADLDTSIITGESLPVFKTAGDEVNAGFINLGGILHVKVNKKQNETLLFQMISILNEATNKNMKISKLADKISNIFVPSVIFLAILTFCVWAIFAKFEFAFMCMICVLVISCPCSLGLATPIAIVCALSNSAKKAILIKDPEILEFTKDVKTIAFDKTGTITKGEISFNNTNLTKDDFALVASVEMLSEHPISKAIVKQAKKSDENLKPFLGKFENIIANGVMAQNDEFEILIGNEKFLKDNNICFEKSSDILKLENDGFGVVFVAINSAFKGYISFADEIRFMAKENILKLKSLGIKTIMLTGDNDKVANFVGEKVGIDEIYSNLNPKQKYEKIVQFQKDGKVMFVGDGLNDTISLKQADVGLCMNSGSDLAKMYGDAILINQNLDRIYHLHVLSKKTMDIIKMNLFWAFFYNILFIPIASGALYPIFGFILNPMFGALAMGCSSLFVVLNSIRLIFFK